MRRNSWIESTNVNLVKRLNSRSGAIFHYDRVFFANSKDETMTTDTACVLRNENGSFHIGFSIQSRNDTYDRKTGNAIAFARASAGIAIDPENIGEFILGYLKSPEIVKFNKVESELVGRKQYSIINSIQFTTEICNKLGR